MAGGWGPSIKSRAFAPDRRVSTVVVQLICNQKVGGSNPSPGTTPHPPPHTPAGSPAQGSSPNRQDTAASTKISTIRLPAGSSTGGLFVDTWPRATAVRGNVFQTRAHRHVRTKTGSELCHTPSMAGPGGDRLPAPGHVSRRPARRHRHPVRPSPHPVRPALPCAGIATATPAPWRSPVAVPVPSPPSRLEPGSHRSR